DQALGAGRHASARCRTLRRASKASNADTSHPCSAPPPPPVAVTVIVSLGAAESCTLTMTVTSALPPGPLQLRLNADCAAIGAVISSPARAFLPFHAPEAEQSLAS